VDKVPTASKSDRTPKALILVRNPRLAFAQAVALFHPRRMICKGIDATAHIASTVQLGADVAIGAHVVIDEGATIGPRCEIGPGTIVGADVHIGEECRIFPGVTLYPDITLGARCVVHAGAVIGSDGFGFVPHEGCYEKFPQVGTVIIGDDVEIGANTTIDRGTLDVTRIGRGTKIDNLVQIAHNVEIGEDVVIAAQTGISGGTVIEDHCVIGGQVGMGDHARVKRGAVVGSKGGILPGKIIREGQVVWGIPAIPLDEYKVINALWRGLPKIKKDVDALKAAQAAIPRPKKARKPSYRHGSSSSSSRKR
jgi:UDP-3-O-[3-hydroxymyristoyl] glucosamine N-acyltransferase